MTEDPHVCTNYCHFCPDLNGMVMPGECMGSIDRDPYTLSYCTCPKSVATKDEAKAVQVEVFQSLISDVRRLQAQVCFLKKEIEHLKKKPSRKRLSAVSRSSKAKGLG